MRTTRSVPILVLIVLVGAATLVGARGSTSGGVPGILAQRVTGVLQENCASCHTDGGIAPFPLERAEDARDRIELVMNAIQTGRMPPWPPGGQTPPLLGERKLSDQARHTILAWINLGMADDPAPSPRGQRSLDLTDPDLRLDLGVDYVPGHLYNDDYRCFLLDPELDQDRFLVGYQVRPSNPAIVHHVVMVVVNEEQAARAAARDAAEEGPGYTCFGGTRTGSLRALGTWVPGAPPVHYPEGTGVRVGRGEKIVVQMHYNLDAGHGSDRTAMDLKLAPTGAAVTEISQFVLSAPVEIRCPGAHPLGPDLCNRDHSLRHPQIADADRSRQVTSALLAFCGVKREHYLTREVGDGAAQRSLCDVLAPADLTVWGVNAHMHQRGARFQILTDPDLPFERVLLDIPRWDFHWQGDYWYREPLQLRRGQIVRVICTWDNSVGNQPPGQKPRYLTWGESTYDEMCLGSLTVTPANPDQELTATIIGIPRPGGSPAFPADTGR